jgi:RNA polymerase sigma factor (sigma-70 family)
MAPGGVYIHLRVTHSEAASQPAESPDLGGVLSPSQFGARFEECQRTLWYVAAAVLNDRTLAHDVVQEAASIAMTKLAEFNPSTSFTAWMSQIVRFVALNEARRRQRQGASLREHAKDSGPGEGPAPAMLTDAAFDQRVSGLLNGLDDTARACLVLRVVHGLAYGEIATALNIPEGTAMSHVHRARTALRTQLAPGEGRSS